MKAFEYRPDIDGLRAIAVLSVVIFHINPQWLPSGFLGVDIFFVLSGFLITSIIYREMLVGAFSFKEFYIRRIRRILPVFFVVLITGLLASWYVFLPKDRGGVVGSAWYSLVFLANRYFARQGEYFDIASNEKPFLHLWSLSIEEQFYFVFPVLLLLMLRISFLRKNMLKILGLGIFILLLSAFVDLKEIGIFWDAYYLSHIRMGEMLVGSFLAIYMTEEKRREEKSVGGGVISIILLAILTVSLFLDKVFVSPYFPGVLALVPCLATAGLIYINQEKTKISSLLSLKPVVWVGKISYSFYLWHWVVLALMRYVYQESEMPMSWNILAVVMMFVLSIFTYYIVENPLRKLNLSFGKNLAYFYIIPASIVGLITYKMQETDIIIPKELEYPTDICHNNLNANCIKGDSTQKPKLLFIGNSYMGALNPWIDKVGKAEGWSAMVISSDSYPFAFDWKVDENYKYKQIRDEYFINHYQDYPIIVFHYAEPKDEYFYPKFMKTLERLKIEGKKVYVIASVRKANIDILRNYYLNSKKISFRKVGTEIVENDLDFISDSLGVRKVDLTEDFPNNFYIDGKVILKDRTHLNVYGSEKIAEIFLSKGKRFIKEEDLE